MCIRDSDKGFYYNSRVVRGGTIYDKGLVSRFKIDTFAQADINSFCIIVDSGDRQVRVARGSGWINGAGGGVASTMNCWYRVTSRRKRQNLVFPIKDSSKNKHDTAVIKEYRIGTK